jgi:hypothetical protein
MLGGHRMTPELQKIALDALRAYLSAPPLQDGRTPIEVEAELDSKRFEVIEKALRPLLTNYLAKSLSTGDFKRQIDGMNKQNPHWGFGGFKGQMFFNMLVNAVEDLSKSDDQLKSKLDDQLRSAICEPPNEENAATSLRNFRDYVKRVGQQFVGSGGEPRSKPNPGSIPFFLSYFWQIHRPEVWPVYYTSTTQMIEGMNLWQATADIGEDYLTYKCLYEELAELFSQEAGRRLNLYDVEHVFWFKSGTLRDATPAFQTSTTTGPVAAPTKAVQVSEQTVTATDQASLVLDGYVPPIVAVIPRLALNDLELQEAARRSATTLERAFEKSINAAFKILGYDARLLGQGMGRVPDGLAIALGESYALLWDAKARSDGYRMGTDDRTIRQYIDTQTRNLRREGDVRKIYYLIVSSGFAGGFDDLVLSLKMETDVNEVCLVEAAALVEIVNQKLREPRLISLGSDGIQQLFSSGGIITPKSVLEKLT